MIKLANWEGRFAHRQAEAEAWGPWDGPSAAVGGAAAAAASSGAEVAACLLMQTGGSRTGARRSKVLNMVCLEQRMTSNRRDGSPGWGIMPGMKGGMLGMLGIIMPFGIIMPGLGGMPYGPG